MDRCESKMNANSFISFTACAIGLKIAPTKSSLIDLYNVTLHHLQNTSSENPISEEEIIDKSLEELISMKAIDKSENGEYILTHIAQAAMAGIFIFTIILVSRFYDHVTNTRIFSGNLDITDAQTVYDELMVAVEGGLILSSYLHLFYLITPYSAVEEIPISRDVVISVVRYHSLILPSASLNVAFKSYKNKFSLQYSNLSPIEKKIAERIGITEVCLIQYSKRGKITVSLNDYSFRL